MFYQPAFCGGKLIEIGITLRQTIALRVVSICFNERRGIKTVGSLPGQL